METTGIRRFFWRPKGIPGPKGLKQHNRAVGDEINIDLPTSSDLPRGDVVSAGRLTRDEQYSIFGANPYTILPPPSADDSWRAFSLDSQSFQELAPSRILELLADLSPEVSKALWDFLRMSNAGFDYRVYKLDGKTEHRDGKRVIRDTLDNWERNSEPLDTIFARMNISMFLRGAMWTETIYDTDNKTAVGFVVPDPVHVRFRRFNHPKLGEIWQLGQYQKGQFVVLDRPTIEYVPNDPFPGSPYGRPLASPAIFTGMFMLGMLHDLRKVIAQQGYPRIDIEVNTEVLLKLAPMDVRGNTEKLQAWIDGMIAQIKKVYANLQPSDAFIHIDAIKLNDNVGVMDKNSLGSMASIFQVLERMSIRALKTMPILMAVMEGASDANSNRQWEIEVQGIKAIQHVGEGIMQRQLNKILQANGIQGRVIWKFAELRSSEELRDEQTNTLKINNEVVKWSMGWTSADESSETITGHDADQQTPRVAPRSPTNEPPANPNDVAASADGSPTKPNTTKFIAITGGKTEEEYEELESRVSDRLIRALKEQRY